MVSKAFEISTATATVLVAGFLQLKPSEALATRGRRAVVVDRPGRKPCWVGDKTNAVWSCHVPRRGVALHSIKCIKKEPKCLFSTFICQSILTKLGL
jgi:hypothetical protein